MKPVESNRKQSRRELFEHARNRTTEALDPNTVGLTNSRGEERTTHMRRRSKPAGHPRSKAVPAPPSAAVIALNRLGFGPRSNDIADFNALPGDDAQRLQIWVDQQLDPMSINDGACDTKLSNAGYTTLNRTLAQLWQTHVASSPPGSIRYQPYYEVERATILRAVWSKRQLLEVLTDFWHNHFNVYGPDYWAAPVWSHWDRVVIRGNALGNFRTMLGRVAQHPAMLYYLDNYTSSSAGPNEN